MRLALVAAVVAATTAALAAPASAVQLTCVSVDTRCQSFNCPAGTTLVLRRGLSGGPWVVVCRPA
jgi:hypothetical protein